MMLYAIAAIEKDLGLDAEEIASMLKNQEKELERVQHQNALMINRLEKIEKDKERLRKAIKTKDQKFKEYECENEE